MKNMKYLLLASFFLCFGMIKAQKKIEKGTLLDGIAAVVGDQIILESDIEEQANYSKQQGMKVDDKCEFLEGIVNNKLLIYYAKKDTLIENRTKELKEGVAKKYEQYLRQFPSEKVMLETYKFRNAYEMKRAIEKIDTDNYYGQAKYGRITQKTDVSPNEVTDFYNIYRYQLPEVKEEVVLSQISIYPKLTDAHKDELINKLKRIKEDILSGESTFETQARIYSEDPGSAANGGLYTNVSKGSMVKVFEATALNLEDGEISDPVETEFGFHIIQLMKKSGKIYDARHILLKAEPNAEEIKAAKKELEEIKEKIIEGKITFKEAAQKYSDDKNTKFNGGTLIGESGTDKIEKINLSPVLAYQIAGLNVGDLTDVFEDELDRKKIVAIVKVDETIPAHQLDLATDYERIKQLTLNKKRNEVLEKWVEEKLPETFITINKRYDDCEFKTNWSKDSK